jgi:hypothetical protein
VRFVPAVLIGTLAAFLIGLGIDAIWPESGIWGTLIAVILVVLFMPGFVPKRR